MYFEICRTYFFFAPNPAENHLPCGFRKATQNAAFFVRIRHVPAPPVRSVLVPCKIRLRSESFNPNRALDFGQIVCLCQAGYFTLGRKRGGPR